MSKKIKYNIVEAQTIGTELKLAVGRYIDETDQFLTVLKESGLCDKDLDVIEDKGTIDTNKQRLNEYKTFVNENVSKSQSVIEALFMSVEVLYAQQVSEFRNPDSKGYKELMGDVKALAYQDLSQVPGLGGILTSEKVKGTAKDFRDALIGTLVDDTYTKLINDTIEYQGASKEITDLYGKDKINVKLHDSKKSLLDNPTKYLSEAQLISNTIDSFKSYGYSKDPSRLAGDLMEATIRYGADWAVGKVTTSIVTGLAFGGIKGAVASAGIAVVADLIVDPTVDYIKKENVKTQREIWDDTGRRAGWKKIQDLSLRYTTPSVAY